MMLPKKAIGYIRISTKEQSNYSLSGQRADIEDYCKRNDIALVDVFEDAGQSAKNFDRLSWHQLETFLKANHKNIDYLIVYKYDRFSRNLSEALAKIEEIETRFKVTILSVMENLRIHPKNPMFFMMRTQLLFNANNELNIIRDRTAFGMHNGAKNGRYLHNAPFGYKNGKDDDKKPLLVIDDDRAHLIRRAFQMFLSGITMEEIKRILAPEGLTLKGKSAMQRLISNPTYAGLIKVPAYYDEPEQIIEAKHEGIIDKSTYWEAQALLSGRGKNRTIYNDEVPLRGVLHCPTCGKPFTAGNSKGKSKYYWYYTNLCEHEVNLSATKLHTQFDAILSELNLSERMLYYFKQELLKSLETDFEAGKKEIQVKTKQLNQVDTDLHSLEEKYIKNTIDPATYMKWKVKYESEKSHLRDTITTLSTPLDRFYDEFEERFVTLTHLDNLYNSTDIHGKQAFVKTVFDNKLSYQNSLYRTPYILPVFALKAPLLKERGLLDYQQPPEFSGFLPHVPQTGSPLNSIIKLFNWMDFAKVA